MSLLSSSVLEEFTSVAVIWPPASIVIAPSLVSTSVSTIASVSSMSTSPAADVEMAVLATVVSRSTPPAASAVSTSAVTSEPASEFSVIEPPWASSVTSLLEPATTNCASIPPPVLVSEMSLLSSSVLEEFTSVAVIWPPASIVIAPSLVSTSVSTIASVSSMSTSPAADVEMAVLATVVSRSTPPAASAVSTSAVTSEPASEFSVIEPPWASSVTSLLNTPATTNCASIPPPVLVSVMSLLSSSVLDEFTSVAVIWPPASIVIAPSLVSTSVSTIASVSSITISPAAVVVRSAESTVVSRSMPPSASATNDPAFTSTAASESSSIPPAEDSSCRLPAPRSIRPTARLPPTCSICASLSVVVASSRVRASTWSRESKLGVVSPIPLAAVNVMTSASMSTVAFWSSPKISSLAVRVALPLTTDSRPPSDPAGFPASSKSMSFPDSTVASPLVTVSVPLKSMSSPADRTAPLPTVPGPSHSISLLAPLAVMDKLVPVLRLPSALSSIVPSLSITTLPVALTV